MFCCPICGSALIKEKNALLCPSGHSFDRARQGYAHLLPSNKMHSKIPGDTREMVESRRAFLTAGHYKPFKDKLMSLSKELAVESGIILDTGCGEGYYTHGLKSACPTSEVYGFDISKFAVKAAAGMYKDIDFAVASVFSIPFAKDGVDLLTNVFAPVAQDELCRVLKPNGYLIMAVPGPRHLWGLKETLYESPYENTVTDTAYRGFSLKERIEVKARIHLEGQELWQIFTMTPYYWKTDINGGERLKDKNELDTEIHFDFLLYRKIER